jgi:hypothetical protein
VSYINERILAKTMLKINELDSFKALARIHAHLCGDGYLHVYKTSEKRRINRATIEYYNVNPNLIAEFRKDMQRIFAVKMTYIPRLQRVSVKSLRIARDLLMLSNYHSHEWRIPNLIKNAPRIIKIEWIKAFCWDEACLPKDRNCIRIKSVNEQGLQDIRDMLTLMKIGSWITGPNCDATWYLNIKKEKEFLTFYKEACRK